MEENELKVKLSKPYHFEGTEYTEVDLSGLEELTGNDITAVEKQMQKQGVVAAVMEMNTSYAMAVAARVTGKPVEFFNGLPAKDTVKVKRTVSGFLMDVDGED